MHDRLAIVPTLSWNVNSTTQIEVEIEYMQNEYAPDYGVPAVNNLPANVPMSRSFSEEQSYDLQESYLFDLDFTHQFDADWEVKVKGTRSNQDVVVRDIYGFGLNEDPDLGPVGEFDRYAYIEPGSTRNAWFVSGNLLGKFPLLGMKHNVLFGLEHYKDDYPQPLYGPALASINIFDPVYGLIQESDLLDPDPDSVTNFRAYQKWSSFYLQDQIDVTDKLHLLLGARYDDTSSFFDAQPPFDPVTESNLTPRYGLVYNPWPWLSLYGHYVESFGTNNGRADPDQGISEFEAQKANQYEVGVKTELLEGRLTSTLAYFELTKQNILTADPDNPLYSLPLGEARSRGIEVDVSGEITNGFDLIASYSYLNAEVTVDNSMDDNGDFTRLGNRLPNTPEHSGSLWATYTMQAGTLSGLKFGAGTYIVSEREGDFENSYRIPGYIRVDAMLGYTFKLGESRISTQVNINNIFDKEYYTASYDNREWILPGAPLSVMGSVRFEY